MLDGCCTSVHHFHSNYHIRGRDEIYYGAKILTVLMHFATEIQRILQSAGNRGIGQSENHFPDARATLVSITTNQLFYQQFYQLRSIG